MRCIYTGAAPPLQQEIENCLWAGGGMKQVEGDVAAGHAVNNSTARAPPRRFRSFPGGTL